MCSDWFTKVDKHGDKEQLVSQPTRFVMSVMNTIQALQSYW